MNMTQTLSKGIEFQFLEFQSQERKRWELQQNRHRKLDENIREMRRYQREHLNASNIEKMDKNLKWNAQICPQNFLTKTNNSKLEAQYGRELERDVLQFETKEQEDEKLRLKQMSEYSSELDKQLREQAEKRMKAYKEFILEKLAIDEIVRRIHEEDQKLVEHRLEKRRVQMAEMEAFRKQQEHFRRENERRIREENERIIREIAEQESREDTSAKNRKERLMQLETIQEKLRNYITAKETERNEIENLRQQLSQEEMEYAAVRTDKEEFKQKLQERLEIQKAHQQSIAQRAKRLAIEKEEEEIYRQQLLVQMAKRDRIEQMSDEKRRQKKLDHRRELDLMIKKRAEELVKLRLEEETIQAQIQRQEELRRRIVEEERNRLLQEHAEQLLGFLPMGLSNNATKAPTLQSDI
ncbi:unnamed protein product [Hymenolepis diminuta]|uniref:Meiosis-specific nuclear structural protein 1 n=2 Tax=Hymenolepis diminuta TaxID=6216 RepID=A0A3P6YSD0_HYMDI|nr:unnamed protein product [Hymenolepis diminuta]